MTDIQKLRMLQSPVARRNSSGTISPVSNHCCLARATATVSSCQRRELVFISVNSILFIRSVVIFLIGWDF